MPVLQGEGIAVDYSDDGSGPPVILVHGGGGGNRQWRALISDLKDRYRLLAVNLRGIGDSSPLPPERTATLDDQAILVNTLVASFAGPVSLIGYSFGGTIAMMAALGLEERVENLIVIEPNPFYLLKQHGLDTAYAEIAGVRQMFDKHFEREEWDDAAAGFVDYWFGSGLWTGMDEKQRAGMLAAMPMVHAAWPTFFDETTPIEEWHGLAERMFLITAADSKHSIKGIRDVLLNNLPGIRHTEIPQGGHMAAIFRPDLVNPLIAGFLGA